jgi:hypothetical protein
MEGRRCRFCAGGLRLGIGFYGPSVFLQTLHDERGWPIALVSAAITSHFLFSAMFVAYLPEAYARWGPHAGDPSRHLLHGDRRDVLGQCRGGLAAVPIAAVSGAGSAATTGAAINTIVAPWFDDQRPKALSMAFNGASIGGLIFTPVWAMAIGQVRLRDDSIHHGDRNAGRSMAGINAICAPSAWCRGCVVGSAPGGARHHPRHRERLRLVVRAGCRDPVRLGGDRAHPPSFINVGSAHSLDEGNEWNRASPAVAADRARRQPRRN